MPLGGKSRRLTQFVIGNKQYKLNRLFYGISIGPAAFSAFMNKIFRTLILNKNVTTYVDDVFMQSQAKHEIFKVLKKNHQILLKENMKAAPAKSHFFYSFKNPWTYDWRKYNHSIKISHRGNHKTSTSIK